MIKYNVNSIFNSISYRVGNILIDPGDEWEGFENVAAVLLTHAHFDHIYGLNRVVELNPNVMVYTNAAGQDALFSDKLNMSRYHEVPFSFQYEDKILNVENEEEINTCVGLTARAYYTPGHNPSCITWVIGDCIFTGDSYIPGIKIVTNLPFGDKVFAANSEEFIKQLSIGRQIFPGHKI